MGGQIGDFCIFTYTKKLFIVFKNANLKICALCAHDLLFFALANESFIQNELSFNIPGEGSSIKDVEHFSVIYPDDTNFLSPLLF